MNLAGQILRGPLDLAAYAAFYRFMKRDQILLACMPKSGSTYLSNSIGRLPGYRKTSLVRHFGRAEQDIDIRKALRKCRYNYVCQHHVKYNRNTAEAIETLRLTPVVLVRNIFDCVVSLRDHLRRESTETPMAFFTKEHQLLNDDELETAIVKLAIPWYIHFYASWHDCREALWITYEEATENTEETIKKILLHAGRSIDEVDINGVIADADPRVDRMNKGTSGRGQLLTQENKERILLMRNQYPTLDFSLIGLD